MSELFLSVKKKSKNKIDTVIGFDIETVGNKNEYILGCFTSTDNQYYLNINNKCDCWRYLSRKNWNNDRTKKVCIVATNLMFDFFGSLLDKQENWKMVERRGKIYSITIRQPNKRTTTIYDTLNFHKASVKQLGEIIQLPKLIPPAILGLRKPKTIKGYQKLVNYCARDAKVSAVFFKQQILKFVNQWSLTLKSTIGSLSMNLFKTHFLKENIDIECIKKHDIAFKSYYGGRTELFKRGYYEDVDCYDFNSLYPAMMQEELPHPKYGYRVHKATYEDIINKEGACFVKGFQKYTKIPILPMVTDKLIFPIGHIQGYYTFVELRYAIENGFIVNHIGEGVIYTKKETFLKDFSKELYNLRLKQQQHNDPMQLMTKLALNNLYGKFAFNYKDVDSLLTKSQLKENADSIMKASGVEPLGEWYLLKFDGEEKPANYSIPIWSAYITSYARIKLHKELVKYQDSIIYCDTDSIFLPAGYNVSTSTLLGELKQEKGYPIDKAVFIRPKMYFTHKAKIKGVNRSPTWDDFLTIIQTKEWTQERFATLRTSLRRKEISINEIYQHYIHFDLNDNKRAWESEIFTMQQQSSEPFFIKQDGSLIPYDSHIQISQDCPNVLVSHQS